MQKNKKNILIGVVTLSLITVTTIVLLLTLFKNKANIVLSDNTNKNNLINNQLLTLMLEQSDGTYQESTSNTWPDDNYIFNKELSGCENGGELSWNQQTNKITLLNNTSDRCYVYFDVYNKAVINNVTSSVTTNSITVNVSAIVGENPISRYYYSINDGEYIESANNRYTFSNLDIDTTYNVKIYVEDTLGISSNMYSLNIKTDAELLLANWVINQYDGVQGNNGIYYHDGTNEIIEMCVYNEEYVYNDDSTVIENVNCQSIYYSNSKYFDRTAVDTVFWNSSTNKCESENGTSIIWDLTLDSNVTREECIEAGFSKGSVLASYVGSGTVTTVSLDAEDNSYRYAGKNPNNYVCFGSDEDACPSDNLYRIIGVFENEVKLIKADFATSSTLGTNGAYSSNIYSTSDYNNYFGSLSTVNRYYWNNSTNTSIWSESNLNEVNLNTNFLNSFDSIWQNKIANHTWKTGGMKEDYYNIAKQYYNSEIGNKSSNTIYNAKIGLMYISDYGYAASPSNWKTAVYKYDNDNAISNNWMYSGIAEWAISRSSSCRYDAFGIYPKGQGSSDGCIHQVYIAREGIRPVFYLNSDVTYVSGSGTSSDPIRIN